MVGVLWFTAGFLMYSLIARALLLAIWAAFLAARTAGLYGTLTEHEMATSSSLTLNEKWLPSAERERGEINI